MSIALKSFQFTPLREGRPDFHGCPCRLFCYFNSRPSARGDAGINTPDDITKLFQFTPLREGRRPPPSRLQAAFYFNSRPSARGDRHRRRIVAARRNFNSRPSARGDKTPQKIFCALSYFNSRPSARGDKGGEADHQAAEISIHAPPRGATV